MGWWTSTKKLNNALYCFFLFTSFWCVVGWWLLLRKNVFCSQVKKGFLYWDSSEGFSAAKFFCVVLQSNATTLWSFENFVDPLEISNVWLEYYYVWIELNENKRETWHFFLFPFKVEQRFLEKKTLALLWLLKGLPLFENKWGNLFVLMLIFPFLAPCIFILFSPSVLFWGKLLSLKVKEMKKKRLICGGDD